MESNDLYFLLSTVEMFRNWDWTEQVFDKLKQVELLTGQAWSNYDCNMPVENVWEREEEKSQCNKSFVKNNNKNK